MEKDVLVQKERGFIEKFMVPQMYDLFRFGGSSVKDDEMGMQRMLQNFSGLFTEEQLRKNMEKYNLQKMFGVVKEYFKKEYGYAGDSIILSNNYQHTINSYIYNDRENPAFIHIDELFESTVIAFLLVVDALMLLRCALGTEPTTAAALANGDIDGDMRHACRSDMLDLLDELLNIESHAVADDVDRAGLAHA